MTPEFRNNHWQRLSGIRKAEDSRETGRRVIEDIKYRIIVQRIFLQRKVEEESSNLRVSEGQDKVFHNIKN